MSKVASRWGRYMSYERIATNDEGFAATSTCLGIGFKLAYKFPKGTFNAKLVNRYIENHSEMKRLDKDLAKIEKKKKERWRLALKAMIEELR